MGSPSSTIRHFDAANVQAFLRRLAHAKAPPWLHAEVARRMGERLALVRYRPQAVLDWWSFGGAGLAVLSQSYPQARMMAVEPTEPLRMRSLRAGQGPWWSPRRWRRSRFEALASAQVQPASAQLVWSNMMLHAAPDPAELIAAWERALMGEGFLMFSCLGPGTLRELREVYRRAGWPAPMAEFVDMHDLGDMLVRAGFADPVMDQEVITLSWKDPLSLLEELRGIGGNAAPQRFAGLRTPRWRNRLVEALQALAGDDGRIHMGFEVAYGHAFKAAPRVPLAAEARISLDEMRAMVRPPANRE